jgi:REP element-mobilizing transposase RayT
MPRPSKILAHHLILSSYGFWLANDPRGSGSDELREQKFADLGDIHHGRKTIQPTRTELRVFYQQATPRLDYRPLWFGPREREMIGAAVHDVVERCGYTVWACAIGSNHAHVCVRYHRDKYETIWAKLTAQARTWLIAEKIVAPEHPVWAERPYSVYLHSAEDIRRTIAYVEGNPSKEGLARQAWAFVRSYEAKPVTQ